MTTSNTATSSSTRGPLSGLRVIELAGIGPVPHAAMQLADMGADVIQIGRPGSTVEVGRGYKKHVARGRRLVEADLKNDADIDHVMRLVVKADVFIEGFRPGVTERLGLGPEECAARNPRLIYARMTGWGQTGPAAQRPGHDINYLAMTGHLRALARRGERPFVPLNLVGDFGGGSMFLLTGILAALVERSTSGRGQTIDAAMVDGAGMLGQMIWAIRGEGQWGEPGTNMFDGGYPHYDTYETADARYMAVGALEPEFFRQMITGLGLDAESVPGPTEPARWGELREILTVTFRTRTRDEWTKIFGDLDACVTPVLDYDEALVDEHLRARSGLIEVGGVPQPAPAPRFARTPSAMPDPAPVMPTPIDEVWP
ncbi:CaiB/BaiF CoA transferase family protein [Rhodococcus artemisiae]|uniref:CaiB/BaiF CoA-transferase family protein n=1 Tax=Rhodococcus artemisiae TaxID=714159 RepID=A0ABU7LC42_9NOCA|nr:CaiB/BaiF CoA-transferase family protein [Rhodococcus artemisiae]MEE2059117.1 CaiB/BaiF CoA-transferase family protein [Rhodococcus artemisiae]